MTEPRKTPRCYAMVIKCHGIPAEFVRGGFGKPRFVLAEDARALEIETQELAEALESAAELAEGAVKLLRQLDMESGRVAAECVLRDARAALARHRAKQEGPTND
jgi:hypothetical protein